MKILIVEDEAPIAEVVSAYAKRDGYDTITAGDGMTALEIFDREDIHSSFLISCSPNFQARKSAGGYVRNQASQ